MIEIDFDHMSWRNLTDEEQIMLCNAVADGYCELVKPFEKLITDSYYEKDKSAIISIHLLHDWGRLAWNLRHYAIPDKGDGTDFSTLRIHALIPLYKVCWLLEYINTHILTE
jgi:hypothetical protein